MSTHRRRISLELVVSLLLVGAMAGPTKSHAQIPGVDQWAQALSDNMLPRWAGQRIPHPIATPRPTETGVYLSSELEALRVHGTDSDEEHKLRQVLAIAERTTATLREWGWGETNRDATLGGSSDFDIYVGDIDRDDYEVRSDGRLLWTHLDSDSSYVIVSDALSGTELTACVTSAYAEGLMMSLDPAEAPAWRRATATYLTWLLTGSFGCHEKDMLDDVARTYEGPIPEVPRVEEGRDAASGGYFIALLDALERGGDGTFIRDMWQLTRQRTWEGEGLRGSPDLWMSIEATIGFQDRKMSELLEQLSVARYLAGTRGAPNPAFERIPHVEPVLISTANYANLPRHIAAIEPPVEPYGVRYAIVNTSGAAPNARLRLWMHAEFGVEWSFVAVPLAADGRELTRISAPPRPTPRSYLEIAIPEGANRVLLAITNLSSRIADADSIDENERSFRLIIDK